MFWESRGGATRIGRGGLIEPAPEPRYSINRTATPIDLGGSAQSRLGQWFNTAAFAIAPVFTVGTASRNPVRGPSYRDVDVALIRRIRVHAGAAIEVRAELFNLLNTPNLGAPAAVAGAANFGTITSALDPRVGQLALKILF